MIQSCCPGAMILPLAHRNGFKPPSQQPSPLTTPLPMCHFPARAHATIFPYWTDRTSRNTSSHVTILLFILLGGERRQVALPLCFMRKYFTLSELKWVSQPSAPIFCTALSPRMQVLSQAQEENNSMPLPKCLRANHCIIKKMRTSM